LELVAGERVVALFNVEGTFYALDGVCAHQGGPLAEGEVTGCVVTCPWHGWQFDVRTGQHQFSATIRQPTLPVRVVGDAVLVDLE
jgi:nitrite reductase (NADH) small subunit